MKLYCFAGPNGSGKSTLFSKIINDNKINVPKDKIRAMQLFKDVLEVADTAYVYDNSKQYKLSLAKINGEIYLPIDSIEEKNNFILPYLKKTELINIYHLVL